MVEIKKIETLPSPDNLSEIKEAFVGAAREYLVQTLSLVIEARNLGSNEVSGLDENTKNLIELLERMLSKVSTKVLKEVIHFIEEELDALVRKGEFPIQNLQNMTTSQNVEALLLLMQREYQEKMADAA